MTNTQVNVIEGLIHDRLCPFYTITTKKRNKDAVESLTIVLEFYSNAQLDAAIDALSNLPKETG